MLSASHALVPAARTTGLVVTFGSDEVRVYDEKMHCIHCLDATATRVWFLCDGNKSVRDIAIEARLPEDVILACLPCLADAHLLSGPLSPELRTKPNRRAFMKKASAPSVLREVVPQSITAES